MIYYLDFTNELIQHYITKHQMKSIFGTRHPRTRKYDDSKFFTPIFQ